jgi:hypothetical protein
MTTSNQPTKTATAAETGTKSAMPYQRSNATLALKLALTAMLILCSAMGAVAQTTSAALSGVVTDTDGARIPGATLVLINQKTRDKRTNKANAEGAYNFSGLTPGEYTLTVTYKGFETFSEQDISLHPGDSSSLPPIAMKIGSETNTITVSARDEVATNGEVSSLITSEDIKHLATEGRDVTELVKILPGFSLQGGSTSSGGLSNASPDSQVAGPGNTLGGYAAVGSPASGLGIISDGANVQDPGQGGATTQTINMDMVEEVKVSTSNFGADVAKGPVVINAVGKSGGQDYHGSIYMVARISQLNSNDWLLNDQGIAKPPDRYLYPGGNVGGPIKIPGTNFNKDKKFLFEVGIEDYAQRNTFSQGSASQALRLSTVPTDAMRGGLPCAAGSGITGNCADFSYTSIANLFNVDPAKVLPNGPQNQCSSTGTLVSFINYCQPETGQDPTGRPNVGTNGQTGYILSQNLDPGAQTYLNSIIPHQNRIAQPVAGIGGSQAQPSDGFDRIDEYLTNVNLYQVRGRLDFNASQNNKFYAVYNTQQGTSYDPFTPYYNPNGGAGAVPDPSLIHAGTNSQTGSVNYVRVFGPTLTNELFAAGAFYVNVFYPINEQKQTIQGTGYPYGTILNNGSKQLPQLGYSSGLPLFLAPDFSTNSSYARKQSFDFGDNLTKVYKAHTIKVGFYFERTANNQRLTTGPTQGQFAEYGVYSSFQVPQSPGSTTYQQTTPDNTIANFEQGYFNSFTQQSANPITDLDYKAIDGYVTDSWKVTKKLTLSGGIRFDHLGPWIEPHGVGVAFWDPSKYYTPQSAYGVNPPGVPLNQLPGITWHGINPNVPSAAQDGRWAFVSPRAGFSYDLYGDGKTVFTGGAGMYRSHDAYNDYVNAVSTAEGVYTATYTNGTNSSGAINGSGTTMKCVSELGKGLAANDPVCNSGLPYNPYSNPGPTSPVNITASLGSSFTVAALHDDQQPLTTNYSFGVNQALPHAGNLVMTYVGSQSSHLLITNAFGSNVNAIQKGGLFLPNPNVYDTANFGTIVAQPDSLSTAGIDDYRPYPLYNGIYELRHGLHSTYHSMQVTWSKWNGPFHYNVNYTWSKALGGRGADSNGSVADATNFRNDYGITAYDRTHIFNASYSYTEGKLFKVNRYVGGVVNGWEISGITNLQSGPNLQAAFSNNYGLAAFYSNGSTYSTDNKTYLGTPDIKLQPVTTCDPSINLQKGQFINGNCLTLGPIGVNGPFTYPYMRGPAYFKSDLSAQKSFYLGGKKEIQIRFAAFNFMNHPLTSLVAATANPLQLYISGVGLPPATKTFGQSQYKEGRRICEMALHYNF